MMSQKHIIWAGLGCGEWALLRRLLLLPCSLSRCFSVAAHANLQLPRG